MPRQFSIKTVLIGSFTVLVVLAMGATIFFNFSVGVRNTRQLVQHKAVLIVDAVIERTRQHLDPAMQEVQKLAQLASSGTLDPSNLRQISGAIRAAFTGVNQIEYIYYLQPDYTGLIAARQGEEIAVETADWRDDADFVHEMQTLARSRETLWGELIDPKEGHSHALINARAPIIVADEFNGAFISGVRVGKLSSFLESFAKTGSETPFILSGRDLVIAHPKLYGPDSARTPSEGFPTLTVLDDPVLSALVSSGESIRIPTSDPNNGFGSEYDAVRIQHAEDEFVVLSRQVEGFGPLPWTIGVYFPRDAIAGQIIQVRNTSIVALGFLSIAIVVILLIGKRISKPIERLSNAAIQTTKRTPDTVERLPPSRIRELDHATCAFNSMLDGLVHRERMRDVFGKFVPPAIAGRLLDEGGILEPDLRTATIFYSDIAGFSTLTEQMHPAAIIEFLNDYFSLLTGIIEKHHGVVHQFQGDAILATYNLPIPDERHAENAIQSAVQIVETLKQHRFEAAGIVRTRIGINTGIVVAGTVGSAGRLGYTVHGDAVNLAARFEEANKQFDTQVLIGETTVNRVAGTLDCRPVATINVRGRAKPVAVFTVPVGATST